MARIYSGVTTLTSSFSGGSENLHHKEKHLRFCSKDLHIGGSGGDFTRQEDREARNSHLDRLHQATTDDFPLQEGAVRETDGTVCVSQTPHTRTAERSFAPHIDNLYHCVCISLLYRPVASGVWMSRRRAG